MGKKRTSKATARKAPPPEPEDAADDSSLPDIVDHHRVTWYTVIMSVLLITLMVGNLACIESYHDQLEAARAADGSVSPAGDKQGDDSGAEDATPRMGEGFPLPPIITLMLFAGAIGGCLYNMRGIMKHGTRGRFDTNFAVTYYLSPLSGAISGLIVVVLLMGGVLTLGLGTEARQSVFDEPGRLMPFVAIAIIAGYGSTQFKRKLDELADTLFLHEEQVKQKQGGE